jgi:hypothetical protein
LKIDTLSFNNAQTQGVRRREWLLQHSPQHLEHCTALIERALRLRPAATSRSTVVLGAGACTEVPLSALCRASDEVVLADLDLAAMQRGCEVLTFPSQRRQMKLVQADLTGGVSAQLARLMKLQPWQDLAEQGAQAIFDAAAQCLEQCPVPDPPDFEEMPFGEFGVVSSSLVLSQLFSYPLLDVLDHVQALAPSLLGDQERHRRYQEAAQAFRLRIIEAHLHLLRRLIDVGGIVVLLSDIRGFVFQVQGTNHDAQHRRSMPLVPRTFSELVPRHFSVIEEQQWEWLTDLPDKERPGRGYEVVGYLLKASKSISS